MNTTNEREAANDGQTQAVAPENEGKAGANTDKREEMRDATSLGADGNPHDSLD